MDGHLPPAQEHKEFLIDPTVRVTQDVKDKQGRVIASAGELINPLSRFPQNLTMIIFIHSIRASWYGLSSSIDNVWVVEK